MILRVPQIKNTSHLGYICLLKNTQNLHKSTFGIHLLPQKHPKSRIRAIWDTFASLKTPKIFIKAHLGCILKQKCTPNQEYEPFGIHLLPQKHPKSSKKHIWDTFVLLKTPQIFKKAHLGCIRPLESTPNQEYEPFGIHLPP